jgi:hypothetical protein
MLDDQGVEEARTRESWRQSNERRKTELVSYIVVVVAVGTIVPVFVLPNDLNIFIIWVMAVSVAGYLVFQYREERYRSFEDKCLLEKAASIGEEEAFLIEERELRLGALWRLTERRLNVYHEIATGQARDSFRSAQRAIIAGFIVIIATALISVFLSENATVTIVVGALGAVGACLSAYIGRTFLRLQESAAAHLHSYFEQPQEQFRYLAAERLLAHLGDEAVKADSVNQLIREMASSKTAMRNGS